MLLETVGSTFADVIPRQYPIRFGLQLVRLFPFLAAEKQGQPSVTREPASVDELEGVLRSLNWGAVWQEAEMGRVCKYLMGKTDLAIPPEFRSLLPDKI